MSKAYNKWVLGKLIPSFPLFMKVWNDTMVVTTNLNRKDAILKRGTFITSVNGLTNTQLQQTMFNYMTEDGYADNVNYLRLSNNFPYYHRNIIGLSQQYTVTYLDSTGATKTSTIPVFDPPKDTSKKTRIEPLVKRSKQDRKKQHLQNMRTLAIDTANNTAIITLNTFSNGKLPQILQANF